MAYVLNPFCPTFFFSSRRFQKSAFGLPNVPCLTNQHHHLISHPCALHCLIHIVLFSLLMGRLISDYYPPPPNSFHYRGRFSAWRYVFGEDQRPSSFTVASKISESLRKDCRIESHFVEVYIKATGQSKVEVTVRWNSLVNRLQKNGFVSNIFIRLNFVLLFCFFIYFVWFQRVNIDGVQYNSYLHDVTSQPWLIERLLGGQRANPDYDLSISVSSMSRVKLHLGDELSCGTPHPLFSPMVS